MRVKLSPQGKYHQNLIKKAAALAGTPLLLTNKSSLFRNYKRHSGTWYISKFMLQIVHRALFLEIAQKNLSLTISIKYDQYTSYVDGYIKFRELDSTLGLIPDHIKILLAQKITLTIQDFNDFSPSLMDKLLTVIQNHATIAKELLQHSFNLLLKYSDHQLSSIHSSLQQYLMDVISEAGVNIDNISKSHPIWEQLLNIEYDKVPESSFNRLGFWFLENICFDLDNYYYPDEVSSKWFRIG